VSIVPDAPGAWGQRNVKELGYAEIEDFLSAQDVSPATRAKIRSALHDFFQFLRRRRILEHYQIPDMPEVRFENAMRTVIPPHAQGEILAEVHRLSYDINPRVWLGIKWLSTYIAMRPGDIPRIREQDVNREAGTLYLRCPKDKRPKLVPLAEEDAALVRGLPAGMPDMPFFRHVAGVSGVAAGKPFGDKYLWKWWRRACENLGIHGVDLYGGTRHSTACALGEVCSPEEIRHATMHGTNKAFERYYTMSQERRRSIYEQALRQRDRSRHAPDKKREATAGGASCKILEFKDKDG